MSQPSVLDLDALARRQFAEEGRTLFNAERVAAAARKRLDETALVYAVSHAQFDRIVRALEAAVRIAREYRDGAEEVVT